MCKTVDCSFLIILVLNIMQVVAVDGFVVSSVANFVSPRHVKDKSP